MVPLTCWLNWKNRWPYSSLTSVGTAFQQQDDCVSTQCPCTQVHERLWLPCSSRPFPSVMLDYVPHKSTLTIVTYVLCLLYSLCCSEAMSRCLHQIGYHMLYRASCKDVYWDIFIYIYTCIYMFKVKRVSFCTVPVSVCLYTVISVTVNHCTNTKINVTDFTPMALLTIFPKVFDYLWGNWSDIKQ
jgi:hypothetical protein